MSLFDVIITASIFAVFSYLIYSRLKKKFPEIANFFPFLEKKKEAPVVPIDSRLTQTWPEKRQMI